MEPHRSPKGKSGSEVQNQDLPSPYGSTIEFDIGRKGSLHKLPSPHPLSSSSSFDIGLSPPTSPPETPIFSESSPLKSPAPQTLGHPPGYDPNRIPSSVFSSKPTNPSEWSATSNESLFSIQMGNSSFSRDYSILFGKSGELYKNEDWNTSPYNPIGQPGDFPRLEEWDQLRSASEAKANESSSLTPVKNAQSPEQSMLLGKKENKSSSPAVQKEKPIPVPASVAEHSRRSSDTNTPPAETTTSPIPPTPTTQTTFPSSPRRSNESGNSGHSFIFPVLVHDGAKSGADSSTVAKENPETPQTKPPPVQPKPQVEPVQPKPQTEPKSAPPDPKAALSAVSGTRWCPCPCLPCFPRWC